MTILSDLLDKGGVVMAILLLLSVYVLAVILFKAYQFWRLDAFKIRFIKNVIRHVEDRNISKAMRVSGNQKNPVARVIEATLRCNSDSGMSDENKVRAIEAAGSKAIRVFENHLRGLEMVANIAPLLGLLGTVIGMVKAFAGIGQIGARVDPTILAGGIWEALLTTVVGLAVAIPALAAHYIIDGRIENIRATMSETVANISAKGTISLT